jgi:hypothetical protein
MRLLALALLAAAALNGASAKRELVDWAEAQPWRMDRAADPARIPTRKGVEFSRPDGEPAWIQLTTRVDVACGEDTSAYLYEWSGDHWAQRFALEPGSPVDSLRIQASNTLVLATGWEPACTSIWHPFFVGLYQIGAGQKTVLEGTENGNPDGETVARLEPNGMRVEFTGASIDPTLGLRRHVLHYAIDASGAHRVDPLALSAQDFVDEWISSSWSDAVAWSDLALKTIHDQLPKRGQMGTVARCADYASVWQVAVALNQSWRYFRVSEQGEHRYRMVAVSEKPCKAAKR